jgi:hypothetical protein
MTEDGRLAARKHCGSQPSTLGNREVTDRVDAAAQAVQAAVAHTRGDASTAESAGAQLSERHDPVLLGRYVGNERVGSSGD